MLLWRLVEETRQCREAMGQGLPKGANKGEAEWAGHPRLDLGVSACVPNVVTRSRTQPDSPAIACRAPSVVPR